MKLLKSSLLALAVAGAFIASTPAFAAEKKMPKMVSTEQCCNDPAMACMMVEKMMKNPKVRAAVVKQLSKDKTFTNELQQQMASEGKGG